MSNNPRPSLKGTYTTSDYPLPDVNFGFKAQIKIIDICVVASDAGKKVVETRKIRDTFSSDGVYNSIVFMQSIGLLEGNRRQCSPSQSVIEFYYAKGSGNEAEAPKIIRKLIEKTWFWEATKLHLAARTELKQDELIHKLALAARAHPVKRRRALICLINYMQYSGLITETGGLISAAEPVNVELQSDATINERIEKVYKPGEIYDFYTDVKAVTSRAKSEVFIIDAYAHEDIIDLYLNKLQSGIRMMILTNKPQDNFLNVASKFKLKHTSNFVVKANDKCHDRLFFVDKKCYVVGQSIAKAAKDQPTYLIEIANSGIFRQVFQLLFDKGKTLA